MKLNRTLLAGLSALALGLGASLSAATAQDAAPAAPTPSPEAQSPAAAAPEVDDTKLKSFAVAFLEVSEVTQQYQPQIAAAGSVEAQQKLQQEAGQKMVEAVSGSEGITVDEYNMIIQAAQADPELAQRINGHITEAAGSAAAPTQPPAQPATE
jgi:hypothetical protein